MITPGCCYIQSVTDGWGAWGDDKFVVGIIKTDLCETFPIYSGTVRADAEIAAANQLPVYLDVVPHIHARKRYVKAVKILRVGEIERPCVNDCGATSILVQSDDPACRVPFYECPRCGFLAFVGKVKAVPVVADPDRVPMIWDAPASEK